MCGSTGRGWGGGVLAAGVCLLRHSACALQFAVGRHALRDASSTISPPPPHPTILCRGWGRVAPTAARSGGGVQRAPQPSRGGLHRVGPVLQRQSQRRRGQCGCRRRREEVLMTEGGGGDWRKHGRVRLASRLVGSPPLPQLRSPSYQRRARAGGGGRRGDTRPALHTCESALGRTGKRAIGVESALISVCAVLPRVGVQRFGGVCRRHAARARDRLAQAYYVEWRHESRGTALC
jgi:hypothetical protein